jgi:hypothetical protein
MDMNCHHYVGTRDPSKYSPALPHAFLIFFIFPFHTDIIILSDPTSSQEQEG